MLMLKYIIEFLFCTGAFLALYKLLIERRVAHSWARRYLIVTMFLSLLIPMLELPLCPAETVYYQVPILDPAPVVTADIESATITTELVADHVPVATIDWGTVILIAVWAIYFIIVALNLARFAWRIYIIGKLRRHSQLSVYELYTLAVSEQVREPFSFWRTIYVSRAIAAGCEFNQVISHELSHIRHHHTAERLALELLRCVAWFNPFVWLAGSALVEVHEWQADSDVLSEGYDVYEYRQLIFRQLFGYTPDMTSGLGSSQTSKKRFLMMTNFKKGKFSFLRIGVALPLVAGMVLAFGSVRAEAEMKPILDNEGVEAKAVATSEKIEAEIMISAAGEIEYNGSILSLEELKKQLLAASDKVKVLNISAAKGARMGALYDVKLAAREAKIFRIRYVTPPQNVDLLLPPLSVQSTSEVKVLRLKPDDRNHLPLFVNANGKVLTSLPDGDMGVVDMAQLKQIVKQFVDNTESVDGSRRTKIAHYSDFKWETIESDNGERHYPVSRGYISIITTRDTSIDKYFEIEQTVRAAYGELRDELAQRSYHKPFASLDDEDKKFVKLAIPIKIHYSDESNPAIETTVKPAQKVSVAVSPESKVESQETVEVVAMPAEASNKEPQQDFSIQPQHAVVQQTTNIKITKLPEGEFRLLSIGCDRNFPDYLLKKFFQSMPTITVKGNKVIVSKHRCDDFIKPGTYDYKIFDDGVLSLIGKSTQGTMPIKLNYKGKGNYEMEIQRSITYNGNRIESLIYYMAKWTGQSKTNLTAAAMQREENVPAGRYKVCGFDTKREWTRVNDKAAKYIMFTAPTFIFGEDNTVEVISPGNNDYIKSGRYAYQMLLDDKKIEPWQVIEKGKIVLTNKENTYTYPCVVKRAHNMRDALSYDLDIYINHNISNINIDVKYISFNSFNS